MSTELLRNVYLYRIVTSLLSAQLTVTQVSSIANAFTENLQYSHPLGLAYPTKWEEFSGKFRFPDHLYKRLSSNLRFFAADYFKVAFFVVLAVSLGRQSLLGKLVMLQYVAAFVFPALSDEFLGAKFLLLLLVNGLVWAAFVADMLKRENLVLVAAAVLGHASLRTRNWTRVVTDIINQGGNAKRQ